MTPAVTQPLVLDRQSLTTSTLPPMFDFTKEIRPSGPDSTQRSMVYFVGEELLVTSWQPDPGEMDFSTFGGHGFDQVMVVISGKMRVIDQDGAEATYEPGEVFALPTGFKGVCSWSDNYHHIYASDSAAVQGLLGRQAAGEPVAADGPGVRDFLRYVWDQRSARKPKTDTTSVNVDLAASPDPTTGETVVFEGPQIRATIRTISSQSLRDMTAGTAGPTSTDAFSLVLDGHLAIEGSDERSTPANSGDVVILPRGFDGPGAISSQYRELAVVSRQKED